MVLAGPTDLLTLVNRWGDIIHIIQAISHFHLKTITVALAAVHEVDLYVLLVCCVCVFKPRCRRVWPRNAREPYHCYYDATAAATADVVWGCRTHSFTIWCTWCDCDNVVLGVHSVTLSCAACAIIPSRQINQKHPYTRRIFARFASNYLRLAILKYGVRCVTFDRIRKRPNGQRRHTLTFHWKFYIKMLLCWVSYTSSYPFGVAFWRSISWRSDGHTFESSKERISRGRGWSGRWTVEITLWCRTSEHQNWAHTIICPVILDKSSRERPIIYSLRSSGQQCVLLLLLVLCGMRKGYMPFVRA